MAPLTPPCTIDVIVPPEQIVCDDGVATAAPNAGFTNTVAVLTGPAHPLTGVIVNVTVTGDAVVLVNEPLILPEPPADIPVTETALFLVQL